MTTYLRVLMNVLWWAFSLALAFIWLFGELEILEWKFQRTQVE